MYYNSYIFIHTPLGWSILINLIEFIIAHYNMLDFNKFNSQKKH